ncbi:MAG TPA: glycosyltransferase [Candidatus Didemnitutus sp.]|nr:glycosyltransferase [Candidatus Didemnitutus sp.]
MESKPPYVALLFTTFPKTSETFLQRDVEALLERGTPVRLYSLWGGGGEFHGRTVNVFNKWRLIPLFFAIIPWNCVRRPRVVLDLFEGVIQRRPPGWLNFWENMLGAGFAGCFYDTFRRDPPALIHGAWAGAPATAGWLLWRILGVPYSTGAHAYDLFEHGGDWWLREKIARARFVQTSTESGRQHLLDHGANPDKVHVIRRGLNSFPDLKPLRHPRTPLRMVCVARLVPKKGLFFQLAIYASLRNAGIEFEARIIGGGPDHDLLAADIQRRNLAGHVSLLGPLPNSGVWGHLAWADVLLHTGVVAPNGDRDGLPNVIPEAMAAGAVVVSSPVSATIEAVRPGETGLLADVTRPEEWVEALRRVRDDDALAERLRAGARAWVEENYDARRNAARLSALFAAARS